MELLEDTPERLLEAAIVEFAEHGFEHATLRDICARAEVNLNAVKYHFDDKQGLYVAAVRRAHAAAQHTQRDRIDASDDTPADEQLRVFIGNLLQMALTNDRGSLAHQLLVMREMVNPTQATEEIIRAFIGPRFAQLDAILRELLPEETPQIDRRMLALSVVGQCLHYKMGRKVDQLLIAPSEYRRFTIPRLTEHIHEVTLAAIDVKHRKLGAR